ncbi:unnamed protein product [Triticum turgidum subsp. durum]|uniref:TF-B3 domain-containing protein n=2 Tax=Triticum TaxID=4564 RepID=A0A9R1QUH2_TRITD|nr:unnamed protein product [Triticum aestivum]VAH82404.1 unnamed protein product [Triticum turgidum subsp. durum]
MAQQLRDSPDLAGFQFYKLMAAGTSWEKLNVPVEFSQSHGFTEKGRVVLRMRGQQWTVCLKHSNRRKGNARTRTALRYGWNRFRVDNGLRVGDICFFQLVHDAGGDDPVLSVEVRKADGTIVQ